MKFWTERDNKPLKIKLEQKYEPIANRRSPQLAKQERLCSAEEGAYATRLTLSSFRAKVSKLGIKGTRQGQKVFYTHKQLEDIYNGVAAKGKKVAKEVRAKSKKPNKSKIATQKKA
jgi:hypothetical protein